MNPTRRGILRTALGFGGIAAVHRIGPAWASSLTETPAQTAGPFYPVSRPLDSDADLTLVQGRSARAQGRIVHVMGRVLDSKGKPISGASIELWQANANGRYAHPADINPAPLDPDFQGFGMQTTDDEGQYRFKTIKPAAYPVNPRNPRAVRPPHIHFIVTDRDRRLVTQMYFPGEPTNESDIIFGQLTADDRRAATANLLKATADVEPDALMARWDIVLTGS
jgi:protocatechuate 3,4-dioxygenase beta subunit